METKEIRENVSSLSEKLIEYLNRNEEAAQELYQALSGRSEEGSVILRQNSEACFLGKEDGPIFVISKKEREQL